MKRRPQPDPKVVCLALAGIAFLAYANSFGNQFTNWDDHHLIVENAAIQSLAPDKVVQIFTPAPGRTFQPIRVLSYAVDYAIWGLNPFGFHLGNTVLHALASVLLFVWLTAWLPGAQARWAAASVALLFAVHPVNVEAVAWLSSRKYGLLAVWTLLALWLHQARPVRGTTGFTAASLCLAIWSSPFGVVGPAVLLLTDCVSQIRRSVQTYSILFVSSGLATASVLYALLGGEKNVAVKSEQSITLLQTLCSAIYTLHEYALSFLVPLGLNNKYPRLVIESPIHPGVLLTLVAIFAVAWFAWRSWPRNRLIAWGVLWTALWLAPVSNLIPISTFRADRYLYLAMIGPLVVGLSALWESRLSAAAKRGLVVAAAICCLGLTIDRNLDWKDSETLWRSSLAQAEDNPIAHNSLGGALRTQGREEEAFVHFQRAFALHNAYPAAALNLAVHYQNKQQYDQAPQYLEIALRFDPSNSRAHNSAGIQFAQEQRHSEALAAFQRALELEPTLIAVWANMGKLYRDMGQLAEAERCWLHAAAADDPEALRELGLLYGRSGNDAKAQRFLLRARDADPRNVKIHVDLGVSYARQGRFSEAISAFARALELEPNHAQAAANLTRAKQALQTQAESRGERPRQ